MGRRDHQAAETIEEPTPEHTPVATVSDVAPRRGRTKVDVTTLDPLDATVHRLKQAHRIAKIGRELDTETRTIAIRLLTEMG